MNGYHIEPISKGLVRVHEDVASYDLSEQDIQEAIAQVQAHRSQYATPLAYQRRLDFFQDALNVAQGKVA